jgi:hypothetical protein
MQGLRKILRALAVVIFPVIGAVIVYGSSSGMETAIGWAFILFALGQIATWFWQPWLEVGSASARALCESIRLLFGAPCVRGCAFLEPAIAGPSPGTGPRVAGRKPPRGGHFW